MRVFAGIPLPQSTADAVGTWVRSWRNDHPGLSYVKPESMHITMHFFGELDEEAVAELVRAIEGLKSDKIAASLGDFAWFPTGRRPRVFYIGLDRGAAEVASLYESFVRLITPLGYREEKRGFVPHITIARNKRERNLKPFPTHDSLKGLSFVFDRFILYESLLSPKGARYSPISIVSFTD